MIDLDFYAWREPSFDEEYQEERLLIPHSDPNLYEDPADGISVSVRGAEAYRDLFEPEDTKDWVLVHYVGTIV